MRNSNVPVWIWNWGGESVVIGVERLGSGPTILLLPALGSISARADMLPLQERLADRFSTVAIDWPGFHDLSRPGPDRRPAADYRAFLTHVVTENVMDKPFATIAAGYALAHAARAPGSLGRLCLLAPPWHGPVQSRDEFLASALRVEDPVLVVYGGETPPDAEDEMRVLAELPNVQAATIPRGKLSMHEECPSEIAAALSDFLAPADLPTIH